MKIKKEFSKKIGEDRHHNNKSYGLGGYKAQYIDRDGNLKDACVEFSDEHGNTLWRTYWTVAKEEGIYIVWTKVRNYIFFVDDVGNVEEIFASGRSKRYGNHLSECIEIAEDTQNVELQKIVKKYKEKLENSRNEKKGKKFKKIIGDFGEFLEQDGKKYKIYNYRDGKAIFLDGKKTKVEDLDVEESE